MKKNRFKRNVLIVYVIVFTIMFSILELQSCKRGEIELEKPKIDVRTLKTGSNGIIESAQVVVSPLLERFAYITYDLVGTDDGLNGNTVFKEFFSDTIDMKYSKNIIGDRTFVNEYKEITKTYHLHLENVQIIPIEYRLK